MTKEMSALDVLLLAEDEDAVVVIDYTNHRGERMKRLVEPVRLHWGATEWHPEPQFFLRAYDSQKRALRDFAVKNIHGVERA